MSALRFVLGTTLCGLLGYFMVTAESSRAEEQSEPSQALTMLQTPIANTWYIRPDGGDRKQCSGNSDAAYQVGLAGKQCAFKHPYYLFTSDRDRDKAWVVQGGDTVIVHGGPYRMGYKGPNAKDSWASCQGDPFGCFMPPVPSGTAERPTRLLGEDYQNCAKKTQLFGGYGLNSIINLKGSSHVEIECLELTDHSQCTRAGAGYPKADGCSSSYPLSDYAQVGITTDARTAEVILKNLDIHGLTARGIIGAIGGDIAIDHVRIAFNGEAGWDFDDGRGTKSAPDATVRASFLTVEWNGCNEEYPIAHAIPAYSCFDQDSAGYGDGIGTPDSPLNFSCDHCKFSYNTQDGLDLLHVKGSLVSVTNSTATGNMGQQWKIGPMRGVIFRNNVTVHNCRRLSAEMPGAPSGYNRYLSLFCRAGGDGITLAVNDDGKYVFQNNSFAGYGMTSYDIVCKGSCLKVNMIFQNNLHVGYMDPGGTKNAAIGDIPGPPSDSSATRDHNIYFNMRSFPSGPTERSVDPKIANLPLWKGESSLDDIDFHLKIDSPARAAGVQVPGLTHDHDGVRRPRNAPIDIGAFEFRN